LTAQLSNSVKIVLYDRKNATLPLGEECRALSQYASGLKKIELVTVIPDMLWHLASLANFCDNICKS
jgi:hypothetical protein